MDPRIRIRIRIHPKMSWIRNTGFVKPVIFVFNLQFLRSTCNFCVQQSHTCSLSARASSRRSNSRRTWRGWSPRTSGSSPRSCGGCPACSARGSGRARWGSTACCAPAQRCRTPPPPPECWTRQSSRSWASGPCRRRRSCRRSCWSPRSAPRPFNVNKQHWSQVFCKMYK